MNTRINISKVKFQTGFNSNPFSGDKYDLIQHDDYNKYELNQRDSEDFNSNLNILTAKYKIYNQYQSQGDYPGDKYEKENINYSQNSLQYDKNSSKFLSNGNYYKNQIFNPFTSTKRQENENDLQNSIERARKNIFQSKDYQSQQINLNRNDNTYVQRKDMSIELESGKIQRRDMSVEMEYGKIPDKKLKSKVQIQISLSNKNKDVQMQQFQKSSKKLNNFDENNYDSPQRDQDSNYNSDQIIKCNKYSHKNQLDSFQNIHESNQIDDQNKIYETPCNIYNKRRGKQTRIIDSSSANCKNHNENSNTSQKYLYAQKYVDQNNIIQNDSSNRKLTRKSTNSLHESYQTQLFNKNSYNKKDTKRNICSSNSKMRCDIQNIQQNNRRSTNECKKLKKLVKNKRISEGNQKRNSDQQSKFSQNCAICLNYPEDNIYGQIKCTHQFCLDCIVQWSKVTNQCPMCRQEFFQILKRNNNDFEDQEIIEVEQKKQRIQDDDEFYWEEGSFEDDDADEVCFVCHTDQDEEKLIVCDHCGIRICHTYCDDELLDDSIPLDDWFCHECRIRSDLFN